MLNKITKINWLLLLAFAILMHGCASTPPGANKVEATTGSQKSRPAQYTYAIDLMKRGEAAKAYDVLNKLSGEYPNADVFTNLAIINLKQKQYDKALENIEKSISVNEKDAISRNIYGLALKNTGKFTRAESEYNKSIQIDPAYPAPYLNIAILYDVFLDSPKKSIPYYRKYQEVSGKNIDKWLIEVERRAK